MADVNRQWVLKSRPEGMVSESCFEWREAPLPELPDGGVLVRNLYLSFDPAMRGWLMDRPSYVPPVQIGEPMRGGAVGQVVESNHSDFDVGSFVQGTFGWQDYAVASPTGPMPMTAVPAGVPLTLSLGVLGITVKPSADVTWRTDLAVTHTEGSFDVDTVNWLTDLSITTWIGGDVGARYRLIDYEQIGGVDDYRADILLLYWRQVF